MTAAKRKVLVDMELLIIDEVSMLRADLLDAIDMVLRYIRRNNTASFGGVQVLFIGDLHQLPPVVRSNPWTLLGQFYKALIFSMPMHYTMSRRFILNSKRYTAG